MTTPAAPTSATRSSAGTILGLAAVCDVVAICVFAAVGRSSHDEHLGVSGVWETAWPFLVGAAVGWLITLAAARGRAPAGAFTGWSPERLWPAGAAIWVCTVVVGMLVRSASGGGVAAAFVVVASIATAVLLLGWRGLAAVIRSRR